MENIHNVKLLTFLPQALRSFKRVCPLCKAFVEDAVHVLTKCPLYIDLRSELYAFLEEYVPNFLTLCDIEKINVILASDNCDIVRFAAKICSMTLDRMKSFLCNNML